MLGQVRSVVKTENLHPCCNLMATKIRDPTSTLLYYLFWEIFAQETFAQKSVNTFVSLRNSPKFY